MDSPVPSQKTDDHSNEEQFSSTPSLSGPPSLSSAAPSLTSAQAAPVADAFNYAVHAEALRIASVRWSSQT